MAGFELEGVEAFEAAVEDMVDDADADERTRTVGTNVEYAPYVEYGTEHTEPQPHVRPGISATEREVATIAASADSLDDFLDRVAVAAVGEIQRRTPVDTGTLRASYRVL